MSKNVEMKETNADVDRIVEALLKAETGDVELPDIPVEKSEGLLSKLRDRDVPVLATPVAHG